MAPLSSTATFNTQVPPTMDTNSRWALLHFTLKLRCLHKVSKYCWSRPWFRHNRPDLCFPPNRWSRCYPPTKVFKVLPPHRQRNTWNLWLNLSFLPTSSGMEKKRIRFSVLVNHPLFGMDKKKCVSVKGKITFNP